MSLGFIFPGQGAQSVGMLGEMAASSVSIGELIEGTFGEASEVLGLDLWSLVQDGPQERLNQTEITQPVLLTTSTALLRVWLAQGGERPVMLAGHSLGEYSALVCAGAIEFVDAVGLVHERGKLMQKAVPQGEGAMAAILGLDDDTVTQCCASVDSVVAPANFNAPNQVVIAGTASAVAQAIISCNEAGARRAVELSVSGPFHCQLMEPAIPGFAQALDAVSLQMPDIPVVHNVDAEIAVDLVDLREKLLAQMAKPVQWTRCVEQMISGGVDQFVECGPGKVLAGLLKRIDRSKSVANIDSSLGLQQALLHEKSTRRTVSVR